VAQTAQALADLTEISSQIERAVVFDRAGAVLASTVDDDRAARLASTALELLRAAEEQSAEGKELAQLDVALQDGSVFVVSDGERLIAATTAPEPTAGLVFYDLKSCLRAMTTAAPAKPAQPLDGVDKRRLGEEPKKPKRPSAKRTPAKPTTARRKKDAES